MSYLCGYRLTWIACGVWMMSWGAATVLAQTTYTWSNNSGDGLWNTTTVNWKDGAVDTTWVNNRTTTGSRAVFGTTGAGAITVADGIEALSMKVNAGATDYVLSGGNIDLGGGGYAYGMDIDESATIHSAITNRTEQLWNIAIGKVLTLTGNWRVNSKFYLAGSGSIDFTGTGGMNLNTHWDHSSAKLNILTGAIFEIKCDNTGAMFNGTLDVNGGTLSLDGRRNGWGGVPNCGIYLGGNPYGAGGTGVLTVRNGGLVEVLGDNTYTIAMGANANTSGTGRGTINIGTNGVFLSARQFWRGYSSSPDAAVINFDGGTLKARANVSSWMTGGVTVNIKNGGAIIDTQAFDATIAQPLLAFGGDSTGGLRKVGSGTLTLSGTNTYNGVTDVAAGRLKLTNPECLSANTDVYLTTGATIDLAFTGTNTVRSLHVDGQELRAKVWHAGNAPGILTGTGFLQTVWPLPGGTLIRLR